MCDDDYNQGKCYSNILFQISIRKMKFDASKQKGVMDEAFVPQKIPLHRESGYDEVLRKCIDYVSWFLFL